MDFPPVVNSRHWVLVTWGKEVQLYPLVMNIRISLRGLEICFPFKDGDWNEEIIRYG